MPPSMTESGNDGRDKASPRWGTVAENLAMPADTNPMAISSGVDHVPDGYRWGIMAKGWQGTHLHRLGGDDLPQPGQVGTWCAATGAA